MGEIEAVHVVDPPGDIRDGHHLGSASGDLARSDAADVPETLDDEALLGERPSEALARALDHHHDAGAGRLAAKHRAADRDRLPRDDLGHRVPHLHRVRVHHPGHRLLVRGHVRSRDVGLWADEPQQLRRVAPGQALHLAGRHLPGCAANAALRAAVRQSEERALPGHPHRECSALTEGHVVVVADAALGRAEHARVLDAVGREDAPRVVVHPHRDADHQRALGVAQTLGDPRIDLRSMGQRLLELGYGCPKERRIPLEGRLIDRYLVDLGHGCSLFPAHEQGQIALDALDDDLVSDVRSFRAGSAPDLARDPHPAGRAALGDDDSLRSRQGLDPGRRLPLLREPDPEAGFTELDRQPDHDRHDAPAGRQPEDRRDDGER